MKFLISFITAMMFTAMPVHSYAKAKKLKGQEVAEIADISVALNGLVCEFCSIALNKTFRKRDEVLGTYIDLDTKVMSVALQPDARLSDKDIIELVKKAGYSTIKISRKDGPDYTPPSKP